MSIFNRLGERTVGFIIAVAGVAVFGLGVFVYTQYTAARDAHLKANIMYNQLLWVTQQGAGLTVTEPDGKTVRPATRLDVLLNFSEQAAARLKQDNDRQAKPQVAAPVTPPVGPPDGGK